MKKFKTVVLTLIGISTMAISCSFDETANKADISTEFIDERNPNASKNQRINMFITHGHCSTPFAGNVTNFYLEKMEPENQGNPLEHMKVSFTIDPTTFRECRRDIENSSILTQGLFINGKEEYIKFKSTDVYTMGVDWYQINGVMSIKGLEKKVKLFATGVRESNQSMATQLIFNGELDLFDWGIDYDKIVSGKSSDSPSRWLYLNMTVEL
ncbi:MAG: YceI family protein [Crocinitomicaceae bacterium]|nr:YceI family protein [Crocinitomicaceae bacterium]